MMSITCHKLDLGGRTVLDLVACGCSSSSSFDRSSVRNYSKVISKGSSRGYGVRRLVSSRRDQTLCRVSSMKAAHTLLNGAAQGPPRVLDLDEPKRSITLSNLFEVVADDLLTLNRNLQSMKGVALFSRVPLTGIISSVCSFAYKFSVLLHGIMDIMLKQSSHVKIEHLLSDLSFDQVVGAENPVLMSAAEQIFGAGGKRMRPALVFLVSRATAELVGLKELTTEHRRLAEIIEMIHTASLIHDDVLDDSDLRRGKETVHQLYGTRVAVLAGDFMFAQSSWYLANLENLEVIKLISQVIKDFASGEIKQASSLFDCDVKLEEYLIKSYYKTASLIAASTKGAAIFSGVDSYIADKMYEYGKNLGLSFQVVDDILDFTQSAEQLGKPAGSDLAKGNLTAPVIFALEKEPKLRGIIESEFSETGSLDEAIELVKSYGGIEMAQELAKEKADVAIQNLHFLPQSAFRRALEDVVMFNLERID